jgi:hypothetical protein
VHEAVVVALARLKRRVKRRVLYVPPEPADADGALAAKVTTATRPAGAVCDFFEDFTVPGVSASGGSPPDGWWMGGGWGWMVDGRRLVSGDC